MVGRIRPGVRRRRIRSHGALRIEQMLVVRSQPQFDQRPRVGSGLALPAVGSLVVLHGFLCSVIPDPGGFSCEIVFANQRLLNLARAFGVDLLLPMFARTRLTGSLALGRSPMG